MEDFIKIVNLSKDFKNRDIFFHGAKTTTEALREISISIKKGETLGIIGESGSGKTTLAKILLKIHKPTSGNVYFEGKNINNFSRKALAKKIQIVFQENFSSLNPAFKVGEIIKESLLTKKWNRKKMERLIRKTLWSVGLDEIFIDRYPHELSGGQRQKVCIARAIAINPEAIIFDESVSATDLASKHNIVELLLNLQKERKITYIFISHDLKLIKKISDVIAVMYSGIIVEMDRTEKIFKNPVHFYTKTLLSKEINRSFLI